MIEACLRAGGHRRARVRQHRSLLPRGGARGARRPRRGGVELPARLQESFHPDDLRPAERRARPPRLARHRSRPTSEAKARIHALQTGTDVHVGNRDDPAAAEISSRAPCELRWFRRGPPDEGRGRLRRTASSSPASTAPTGSARSTASEPGTGRMRPPRRPPRSRSAWTPPPRRPRSPSSVPRRTGARSSRPSTGCGSSTTPRPPTCTRRWRRSTAPATPS